MIALTNAAGRPLRFLAAKDGEIVGYHRIYGVVSERSAEGRRGVHRRRPRHRQTRSPRDQWLWRIKFDEAMPTAVYGCKTTRLDDGRWSIDTARGPFFLVPKADVTVSPVPTTPTSDARVTTWLGVVMFALFVAIVTRSHVLNPHADNVPQATTQKTVVIPKVAVVKPKPAVPAEEKKEVAKVKQEKPVDKGAAVRAQLGFLALLGKKDIHNKVNGGMPTSAERRTAGAGAGGTGGSGGELLSGLGQGLHKTTVGNTGVKGLGGIGNAGAGGGEGGFGTAYVGSGGPGGGRALSDVKLVNDMVLEGGLDKAVIQATIAKYLSQVRACYERGLRERPGLTGQVAMDFEIAATGRLNYAKVKTSSLGHDGVETCIAGAMLGWQFPKPVGGTLVKVNYPFMLKPASYM